MQPDFWECISAAQWEAEQSIKKQAGEVAPVKKLENRRSVALLSSRNGLWATSWRLIGGGADRSGGSCSWGATKPGVMEIHVWENLRAAIVHFSVQSRCSEDICIPVCRLHLPFWTFSGVSGDLGLKTSHPTVTEWLELPSKGCRASETINSTNLLFE